ncbi:bacteriocin immunity protein [Streptococcus caviae]|uniref:bacteriocin immunity protein n=1 Tax=Streptococcus sp. 'caviae' TaxID=1915004 RepID=UPI00094B9F94|nr:bacteriocin immunity protein [Streptococcus sp. 'caviae']OLN83005.1 bacteriocin immunity protein [Streptococcus sp. 'caviae']
MTKKSDDEKQKQIMTDYYNLLLNPDIYPEERELLLDYKQEVEAVRDFSRQSYRLCRELERLSLKYLQRKKGLSEPVKAFYDALSDFKETELRNNEIAKGIIAASATWL